MSSSWASVEPVTQFPTTRSAVRGTLSTPHHHPKVPRPFHVQLPHAGSWTDAEEGGWIHAGCRGDSATRAGVSAKPGFALGALGVGAGGA